MVENYTEATIIEENERCASGRIRVKTLVIVATIALIAGMMLASLLFVKGPLGDKLLVQQLETTYVAVGAVSNFNGETATIGDTTLAGAESLSKRGAAASGSTIVAFYTYDKNGDERLLYWRFAPANK